MLLTCKGHGQRKQLGRHPVNHVKTSHSLLDTSPVDSLLSDKPNIRIHLRILQMFFIILKTQIILSSLWNMFFNKFRNNHFVFFRICSIASSMLCPRNYVQLSFTFATIVNFIRHRYRCFLILVSMNN